MLDDHLLETLSRYPSSDPTLQYLLAFALDSPFDCDILLSILPRFGPSHKKSNVIHLGSDNKVFSLLRLLDYRHNYNYRSRLSAFFNDCGRSGSYFRGDSVDENLGTDWYALLITLDILSRFLRDL